MTNGNFTHLTPDELAVRWNRTGRTLERWRAQGRGPAYVRLGGRIVYRRDDIEAYERMRRIVPEDRS